MSKIYVYDKQWRLEGKFDGVEKTANNLLVTEEEIEEALRNKEMVKHKYLVEGENVEEKIHEIIQLERDKIIDEIGTTMDKDEDERIELLAIQGRLEIEKNKQEELIKELKDEISDYNVYANKLKEGLSKEKASKEELQREVDTTNETVTKQEKTIKEHGKEVKKYRKEIEQEVSKANTYYNNIKEIEGILTKVLGEEKPNKESLAIEETAYLEDTDKEKKGVNWEDLLVKKELPLRKELYSKGQWHISELAARLVNGRIQITEKDLEYITDTVFEDLKYKKDKANSKIYSKAEAVLIIFAVHTNISEKYTGLARLEYAVRLIFDDWLQNKHKINTILER